ncbi:hypothetical protein I4U23_000351 [Adineta vaga]|nr:hypothetical protein I4U23_000351 [Adineta vaga]
MYQWILLYVLFSPLWFQYSGATWPQSNSSNIQLLGLFSDSPNASEAEITLLSVHSRAMFQAAMVLAQRYNITVDKQLIGWQTTQTRSNAIYALSSVCQGVSISNTIGIVGPELSSEAHTIGAFAKTIGIPVISYSATDPTLSDRIIYPTFHRTVPSDTTIALAIVQLFVRFGWTSCIIIYQNDAFGSNGADVISDAFNENNLSVVQTLVFDIATQQIRGNLKDILTSSPSRIVLLWAVSSHTSLILQNALDNNLLGPQFLWILSSPIVLNTFNQTFHPNLIGILTVEPAVGTMVDASVNTTLLNSAYDIWQQYEPETFPGAANVDNYALFAFDAAWSLIQSLQNYCSSLTNISSSSSCLPVITSTFCFDYRFVNPDGFLSTIDATSFLGVSGLVRYSNKVTNRIDGNFFMIRNIQPSSDGIDYISVLKWVDTTGWKTYTKTNAIVWPNNTLIPPTGFPKLSGVKLRIGVIRSPPFLMMKNLIDASGKNVIQMVGFIPDLIDRLQSTTGLIPEIILAPLNQTYGGMIQAVINDVYDIVVGDVTVTAARREIVDFSTTIYDNTFSVIVRQTSSVELDYFSYLRPFSLNLWLTLLVACIYAAVLFWILERKVNDALRDKSILSSISLSIWYSLGTVFGYGVEFAVQTAAGRLLTLGLYMLSMILVATYTANLASDLTLLKSKGIISGIDDVKNGKVPFSRVGILVNSSFEDYFLREVSSGSRNYYPIKTQDEIYTSLFYNYIDASIMDTGLLQYATNTLYCNLSLAGTTFNPNSYAIVIPKQWLYTRTLDVSILSLKEFGVLDELKTKWFAGSTCSDSSSSNESTGISIETVCGLFLTFAIISILSLLLFVWTKRLSLKDHLLQVTHRKNLERKNADLVAVGTVSNRIRSQSFQESIFNIRM